jgi:hypothetical protein
VFALAEGVVGWRFPRGENPDAWHARRLRVPYERHGEEGY